MSAVPFYTSSLANNVLGCRNPKIAVFVTTHSESERGDLHAMQGNQGANAPVTVSELFCFSLFFCPDH